MIASLPMYWRQENAAAWRAVWADLTAVAHAQGVDLPALTPPEDIPEPWTEHWLRPDLALSQTCSMPLRTALRDRVTYVGTFDFGLDGPEGHYHSVLVARDGARPVETLALNGYDSQSGFVAGAEALDGEGAETALSRAASRHVVTGAHRASLRAVAEGAADAAYLDAVTFRLIRHFDPPPEGVSALGRTRPTPGLPLVTARGRDPRPLRAALGALFEARPDWLGAAELGGLRGFCVLPEEAYLSLPVPDLPRPAAAD